MTFLKSKANGDSGKGIEWIEWTDGADGIDRIDGIDGTESADRTGWVGGGGFLPGSPRNGGSGRASQMGLCPEAERKMV